MKPYRYLIPLLLSIAFTACRSAEPYQTIELAPGEKAAFGSPKLNVEFVRVVEDTRCPSDATCVWAGEVKVQLLTRLGTAEAVSHEIAVGQQATVGERRVTVVQVQPERTSTGEIAPQQYRVTVKVERSGG